MIFSIAFLTHTASLFFRRPLVSLQKFFSTKSFSFLAQVDPAVFNVSVMFHPLLWDSTMVPNTPTLSKNWMEWGKKKLSNIYLNYCLGLVGLETLSCLSGSYCNRYPIYYTVGLHQAIRYSKEI